MKSLQTRLFRGEKYRSNLEMRRVGEVADEPAREGVQNP